MIKQPDLSAYKQKIADLYSERSAAYDSSDWHLRIAHRLVDYGQIKSGQRILDIATGTGMAALRAAQIAGPQGFIVGIDISAGMLEQAKKNARALNLGNVEFQLADAEALELPENSFDHLFCSSALIWMSDLRGALSHWYKFLKPGGRIGFHAFAETAFVGGIVLQGIVEKRGIPYSMSRPAGTAEKCRELLHRSGFELIEVRAEQDGGFISQGAAQAMWPGSAHPAPGQFPNPLSRLSPEQLRQVRAEFENQLRALETVHGVWNDITTFYVSGRKPIGSVSL